jgi:hypothetical protein
MSVFLWIGIAATAGGVVWYLAHWKSEEEVHKRNAALAGMLIAGGLIFISMSRVEG